VGAALWVWPRPHHRDHTTPFSAKQDVPRLNFSHLAPSFSA
jgi:hypothetical protein